MIDQPRGIGLRDKNKKIEYRIEGVRCELAGMRREAAEMKEKRKRRRGRRGMDALVSRSSCLPSCRKFWVKS